MEDARNGGRAVGGADDPSGVDIAWWEGGRERGCGGEVYPGAVA